jgi:hypothetical protein
MIAARPCARQRHIKIYCEDGHDTCIKIHPPRAAGYDIESIGAAMAVPVQ